MTVCKLFCPDTHDSDFRRREGRSVCRMRIRDQSPLHSFLHSALNLMPLNYLLCCCNCFTHLFHVITSSLVTSPPVIGAEMCLLFFPRSRYFLWRVRNPESLDEFHQQTSERQKLTAVLQ